MKIQIVIFWVLTPCSYVVGYRRFRGSRCRRHGLRNVGILSYHYTLS